MAVQKGAEVLVKVGDGASPEAFTTIGGLRDTSISINQSGLIKRDTCMIVSTGFIVLK